jgi:ABC-type multidrug transport system fused ATPase/permease subunit
MAKAARFHRSFWAIIAVLAACVHFGSAALRINSFFPSVQAYDFSSYYTAAWSIRLNMSPYSSPPEVLDYLAKTQNLLHIPPICASTPLWAWLMQPLTAFPFPSAAALWLLILIALAVCCHILLVQTAGFQSWKIIIATLPITLTFGPLFLNLTLGQNAIVLLLCALLMGKALSNHARCFQILWIPLWLAAVAAKILPVLWLGCLPFLKQRRTLLLAFSLCLATFLAMVWLEPESNDYWQRYLIGRAEHYSQGGNDIDDQSLKAFIGRIARPSQFEISGINLPKKQTLNWNFPWEFSSGFVYGLSAVIVILIGLLLLYSWVRSRNRYPTGELYSLILFTLVFFPNMQRYNHVLALPAIAWLWNRGPRCRNLTIAAYALFALSRLNHIWAALLPSLLASVASGFGLCGILLLLIGVAHELQSHSGQIHNYPLPTNH